MCCIWPVVNVGAVSDSAVNVPAEHMETGASKPPRMTLLAC